MKRYDLVISYRCGSSIEEMEASDCGEWVRYEDVEGLEREVLRLKTAMKEMSQEAHLASVRLANAALSPDDLATMLGRQR